MAQHVKINPCGRKPGYKWTDEQKEAIRHRAREQHAERKAKRQKATQKRLRDDLRVASFL